jgi:hypothetical protein
MNEMPLRAAPIQSANDVLKLIDLAFMKTLSERDHALEVGTPRFVL